MKYCKLQSCILIGMICLFGLVFGGRGLARDLDTSATGYGGYGPHGQVHITVHRGPTKKYGYNYFAPFSYYVRQPEDSHYHHKGYY